MSDGLDLLVRRANRDDIDALAGLFRSSEVPCFCQYFSFEGDHRQWQDRCANSPEENARALAQDLERENLWGLVAEKQGELVGWARLATPGQLEKRYESRLYRALPCFSGDRAGVVAVTCFLVSPGQRGRGVATKLLEGGIELARNLGAQALEAFPRGAVDVGDAQQWTGPQAMYLRAGFRLVHDFPPYPVLRLQLR